MKRITQQFKKKCEEYDIDEPPIRLRKKQNVLISTQIVSIFLVQKPSNS